MILQYHHDIQNLNTAKIKETKLQATIDSIKHRFGKNAALRGSALKAESTIIARNGMIGGHNK